LKVHETEKIGLPLGPFIFSKGPGSEHISHFHSEPKICACFLRAPPTIMNQMFNTYQPDMRSNGYNEQKMKFNIQNNNSLFSMALYDLDSIASSQHVSTYHGQHQQSAAAAFHPVDEYKDLSLKELLDLSDDFLFDDINPSLLEPSPLPTGVPSQTVQEHQRQLHPGQNSTKFSSIVTPERNTSYHFKTQPKNGPPFVSASSKRSLEMTGEDAAPTSSKRFRPYQAGQWVEKFDELCDYRDLMGHCLVPHTYSENLPLARWVKRQRYQYKLMKEGKPSTMTEERVVALSNIGFVWDSQGAAWGERLGELKDFRKAFMHCNVPSNYSENPQLATWVKCQRRQYKLHVEGKSSNMTSDRVRELESLGFEWELRTYKKSRVC
jgi:hypothetical protein